MRNLATLAFGLVALVFLTAGSAVAGNGPLETCPGPCQSYQRALRHYAAPSPKVATTKVVARAGKIRVRVLNSKPDALVLYRGRSRSGAFIANFAPDWTKTNRGYVATIVFDASLIADKRVVALCDGDGQSVWDRSVINYFLANGTNRVGDEACTGGKRWCAKRGL